MKSAAKNEPRKPERQTLETIPWPSAATPAAPTGAAPSAGGQPDFLVDQLKQWARGGYSTGIERGEENDGVGVILEWPLPGPKKVYVIDTTFRDGEREPGVVFPRRE
jgi:hypothetical protein